MSSIVARVNGAKTVANTVYNNNCNLYIITVKNASSVAVDLTADDSPISATINTTTGITTAVTIGVAEAIVREICPLAYFIVNDASGRMYVVMDLAIDSATELQTRIRTIGGVAGVGSANVVISGTLVVAATTFTVA
jgi:hypothetical protein